MRGKLIAKAVAFMAALLLAACVVRVGDTSGETPGASMPAAAAAGHGAEVVRLVNLERKKAGLPALRAESQVAAASATHAGAMAKHACLDFDCGGHTVDERLSLAGYRAQSSKFFIVSSNTAPAQVVRGMMSKSWGRDIILNPEFHHIGAASHGGYWAIGFAAPALDDMDALAVEVLRLTNAARGKHGLAPLALNPELNRSAQFHADFMAGNDCFDHKCRREPELSKRIDNTGYVWRAIAENIAAGQTSAAEVVEGWMNSPGHRANILNPAYSELGVGYTLLDRDGGKVTMRHYWVQNFGRPRQG